MKIMKIMMALLMMIGANAMALPTAKITVKVVDEAGNPLEGVKAVVGFTMPKRTGGWGSVATGQNGLTDEEGIFSAEGETEPHVGLGAMKDGYYRTSDKFNQFNEVTGMIGLRKWQPWNPTVELVLKEIKQPIPLYAVNIGLDKTFEIPVRNEFIGFDLIARDWVVPHGSGTRKDFLIKLEGEFTPSPLYVDQILTLRFPNPDDGIQSFFDEPNKGSVLRLPHHAPVEGYQSELVLRNKSDSKTIFLNHKRDDQNYFFRVRSESDGKGNIASALYGKIHGSFSFAIGNIRDPDKSSLHFNYYLNPKPNDTNLEFDPKKNLFTDLKGMEAIGLTP